MISLSHECHDIAEILLQLEISTNQFYISYLMTCVKGKKNAIRHRREKIFGNSYVNG
jgi:hypothetical protein